MRIVRSKRAFALLAALLLLLAGCSDPQGSEPGDAVATTGADANDEASRGEGGPDAGASKDGAGGSGPGGTGPGAGGGDEPEGGGTGSRGPGGGAGRGSAGGPPGGSGGYLAEGEYVYDQQGFERFCQATCNKQKLPATATITASYSSVSGDEAVIVTEAASSEQQRVTTTTRHTPSQALITNVTLEFAYSGFSFSQSYDPKPAVESLSFPLEVGKAWRGRWKARTSGDYRMKVVGASNGVYEIETVTNFRGDFSGRAQATVWVDGDTRAIVRTDGEIAVASGFGEYTSDFRTTLRSAPSP